MGALMQLKMHFASAKYVIIYDVGFFRALNLNWITNLFAIQ
jgi:hypothetical protein